MYRVLTGNNLSMMPSIRDAIQEGNRTCIAQETIWNSAVKSWKGERVVINPSCRARLLLLMIGKFSLILFPVVVGRLKRSLQKKRTDRSHPVTEAVRSSWDTP
jgi:cytochrome c-type biogenesis protein CcmH/NrfF